MVANGIPAALSPYIAVRGAAEAIDFYKAAFGAVESYRLTEPGGKVGHAELTIDGALLMLSDEYPDFGAVSPAALGGSPVALYLRVADADAAATRAVDAGATLVRPPQDEFWGGRTATVACPFGYRWMLAHTKEEVTPAEMQKRWTAMLSQA